MKKSLDIGIIGGGITGLTLGYYLSKKGHRPVIFEKDSELGGLISAFELYGARLEKYYHHIFASDKHTLELIKDLGLSEKIDWLESSIGLFYKGKTYSFSAPLDLLRFPHLSLISKLRAGLGTIYLQRYKNWEKLKDKRAPDWIKKYLGKEVWQTIWQPLFQGKFNKYYQDIAMSWFWARIHSRSAAKFRGKERLGYPKNSYQEIINRLSDEIIRNKGEIFINQPVEKLVLDKESKVNLISKGKTHDLDLIISTIAPPLLSSLLPNESKEFKKQLSEIIYLGNISAIFVLKEKLTDYYWTNILDNNFPFAGIIEHTNLVNSSKYQNKHIVYISHYASLDSEYFNFNHKELINRYSVFLKKVNPKIKTEDAVVFKEAYAQPVVTTSYPYRLLQFKTPVKNLYQLSMAQIFPDDRGVNFAIREAKKLVNLLI